MTPTHLTFPRAEPPSPTAAPTDGPDATAWPRRGRLREGQGQLDEALASYQQAVRLDPRRGGRVVQLPERNTPRTFY
jgi:hypothetical protein